MFQLLIYRRDITDNPDFRATDRPGGGFLTRPPRRSQAVSP
ncbi:MAG: hypothetical protein ACREV1_00305 [Gammaproteobacteria bacterium]